ncbi:MAG: hypothetical protein ACFUZC_08030 [Chthoniobacteraceae bacterium]
MKTIGNEDLFDRVSRYADTQLEKFPSNAGISPGILLCKPQDQLLHTLRNRRSPLMRNRYSLFHANPPLVFPAQEGFIAYNGKQLLDRIAQRRSQANQQRALRCRRANLFRQTGAQDFILGFEISNLPKQNGLGQVDQKNEERVLAGSGHRESPKSCRFDFLLAIFLALQYPQNRQEPDFLQLAWSEAFAREARSFCTPVEAWKKVSERNTGQTNRGIGGTVTFQERIGTRVEVKIGERMKCTGTSHGGSLTGLVSSSQTGSSVSVATAHAPLFEPETFWT